MVKIGFVRTLSHYENYADVEVYDYNDGSQKFFFDENFINEKRGVLENGNLVSPPTYDAIVSLIGKTYFSSLTLKPVERLDEVKRNIREFFLSHNVGRAKTPPGDVFFE